MGDPSVHNYLTTAGMETVARAAPLGERSILELPLLLLRGVVLFPGESLPLRLHSLDNIRLVLTLASQQQRARARAASGGHHLGVLNTRRPSHLGPGQHPALLQLCESVGTTAELEEVETADNWSVEEGMAAKARGRHRFRIIPPGQPGHGGFWTFVGCVCVCWIGRLGARRSNRDGLTPTQSRLSPHAPAPKQDSRRGRACFMRTSKSWPKTASRR